MKVVKYGYLKVDGFCVVEVSWQMDFDNFLWDNNVCGILVFVCVF